MHSTKEIAFALITITLMFAVAEGLARLLIPEQLDEPVVPQNVGSFDPMLGWSLQPGSRGVSQRTGRRVEYKINSQGMRDDETSVEKPPGIFRIVLVGDSRTFGFGVPIEQHFSRLLEGYFKDVEVINLGVSGYGVDQELLRLRYSGFKFNPDLVIAYVAHYGDHRHMSTIRFGMSKPAFLLEDGRLKLINSPVVNPSDYERDRSVIWSEIKEVLKLSKIVRLVVQLRDLATHEKSPLNNSAAQQRADEENLHKEKYRRTLLELGENIIFEMAKESESHGAKFLLVTQIEQLETASRAQNIKVLNVSASLANRDYNLSDDQFHTNEVGNGALSWEIARFLKESGLVPADHVPAAEGPRY